MNKNQLQVAPDSELAKWFESAAIARGRALYANDSKTANKAFDEESLIQKELSSRGTHALESLLPLLESANPWVRCDAAIQALFFATEQAVPVLESLKSEKPGMLRTIAVMTLDRWKEGKLKPLNPS
jgi:hypothetical protein